MDTLDPLLLSRIQFAFTISFHILFPSFTIGLAAWQPRLKPLGLVSGELGALSPRAGGSIIPLVVSTVPWTGVVWITHTQRACRQLWRLAHSGSPCKQPGNTAAC